MNWLWSYLFSTHKKDYQSWTLYRELWWLQKRAVSLGFANWQTSLQSVPDFLSGQECLFSLLFLKKTMNFHEIWTSEICMYIYILVMSPSRAGSSHSSSWRILSSARLVTFSFQLKNKKIAENELKFRFLFDFHFFLSEDCFMWINYRNSTIKTPFMLPKFR